MMMYQLLTTVSSNKVTAKGKAEREKCLDQTHFFKVRFKGPLSAHLEYHAPKRWRPRSLGCGLRKNQARPSLEHLSHRGRCHPGLSSCPLPEPSVLEQGSGTGRPWGKSTHTFRGGREGLPFLEKQSHISPFPLTPALPQDLGAPAVWA